MMSYKVFIKVFIRYTDLFAKNYRVHGHQVQKKTRERGLRWKKRKGQGLLAKLIRQRVEGLWCGKEIGAGGYGQNNHLLPIDTDRTEEGPVRPAALPGTAAVGR
jgi:hypothetical protein